MRGAAAGCSEFAAAIRCSGRSVADPDGIEGPAGEVEGLCLLDVETVLTGEKTLREVEGERIADGAPFRGYEMHVGRTTGPDCARPLLRFADGRVDGATSESGLIAGAYVHGLFADDRQRAAWLGFARRGGRRSPTRRRSSARSTSSPIICAAHLDLDAMLKLAR